VIDLNKVVENVSDMLSRVVGEDVTTTFRSTFPLGTVKADVGQVEQVLMNLVVNARDAMPNGGRITIETKNVELDESYHREHDPVRPGPYVMLSVADTGSGMDEITKARMFEPFYTTKGPGKGTGLGLSTVYGIVKQNRGYIWAYSEAGTGTIFKIYLPRVDEAAEVIIRSSEKVRPRGGSETILLVEDDEALRALMLSILHEAGYTLLEADSPEKAVNLMREKEGAVHLLLTDLVMPQTSGTQLLRTLKALHPQLRVILMSGYAAEVVAQHGPIPPNTPLIEKPFTLDSLLSRIRAVLDE
jgi:CheY-like chemotaxis protein